MDAKEVDVAKVMIKDWVKSMCDAYKIDNEEIFNMLREDDDENNRKRAVIVSLLDIKIQYVRFSSLGKYRDGIGVFRICESLWVIDTQKGECYVADRELARECENAYRALKNK